jgi:hypothetical protein
MAALFIFEIKSITNLDIIVGKIEQGGRDKILFGQIKVLLDARNNPLTNLNFTLHLLRLGLLINHPNNKPPNLIPPDCTLSITM